MESDLPFEIVTDCSHVQAQEQRELYTLFCDLRNICFMVKSGRFNRLIAYFFPNQLRLSVGLLEIIQYTIEIVLLDGRHTGCEVNYCEMTCIYT